MTAQNADQKENYNTSAALLKRATEINGILQLECEGFQVTGSRPGGYFESVSNLAGELFDITTELSNRNLRLKARKDHVKPASEKLNTLDLIKKTVLEEAKTRHLAIDTIEIEWSESNHNRVEAIKISGHRAADIWTRHSPLPSEVKAAGAEYDHRPGGQYPDGGIVDELNTDKENEED